MAQFTNNAEGGSNTTALTSGSGGNTGGTSGNFFDEVNISGTSTLKFATAAAAHGTLGIEYVPDGSGSAASVGWTGLDVLSTQYGRIYLQFTAVPASTKTIRFARLATTAAQTIAATVLLDSNGHIQVADSTGSILATGTTALSINTIYRVEFQVIHSATVGQITARLYVGDSAAITETIQSAASANTLTQGERVRFGQASTSLAASTFRMDDLVAGATNWPGPAVAFLASPVASHLQAVATAAGW